MENLLLGIKSEKIIFLLILIHWAGVGLKWFLDLIKPFVSKFLNKAESEENFDSKLKSLLLEGVLCFKENFPLIARSLEAISNNFTQNHNDHFDIKTKLDNGHVKVDKLLDIILTIKNTQQEHSVDLLELKNEIKSK